MRVTYDRAGRLTNGRVTGQARLRAGVRGRTARGSSEWGIREFAAAYKCQDGLRGRATAAIRLDRAMHGLASGHELRLRTRLRERIKHVEHGKLEANFRRAARGFAGFRWFGLHDTAGSHGLHGGDESYPRSSGPRECGNTTETAASGERQRATVNVGLELRGKDWSTSWTAARHTRGANVRSEGAGWAGGTTATGR